jgi:oxygen-independent coproporphyrinogen-3 oxidase
VDLGRISEISGLPVARFIDDAAVQRLERQGLVHREDGRLRVTTPGMLVLDALLGEIVRT